MTCLAQVSPTEKYLMALNVVLWLFKRGANSLWRPGFLAFFLFRIHDSFYKPFRVPKLKFLYCLFMITWILLPSRLVQTLTDLKSAKPPSCHSVFLWTKSHIKSWVARQCMKLCQNVFYSSWYFWSYSAVRHATFRAMIQTSSFLAD